MAIKPVTKEKIKALLRAQVEYDPEPAIAQMETGDVLPVCNLFSTIANDASKRCNGIKIYVDKIVAVLGDLQKEVTE